MNDTRPRIQALTSALPLSLKLDAAAMRRSGLNRWAGSYNDHRRWCSEAPHPNGRICTRPERVGRESEMMFGRVTPER